MADCKRVQFDLVELLNGERILRLTDLQTVFSLEKKLKPAGAVFRQTDHLLQIFEAALARAEVIGVEVLLNQGLAPKAAWKAGV